MDPGQFDMFHDHRDKGVGSVGQGVGLGFNGVLQEAVSLPGASFGTLLDADGAALVIHARADDYATDPSGNSGDRIACGVISLATVVPAR